jgi:hypothetical protein
VARLRFTVLVLSILAAAGAAAGAQAAPSPAAPVQRGWSSQVLISQLSLYLPEEATRGMYRGLRNGPSGGSQGSGGQGSGGAGGPGAAGGRAFPQIQFSRDPALFLTKEQITKLLPILQALRDAPLPTPSRARQVQADVDAQLTVAQKAEWVEFQKKMRAAIEEFRQRMAASGGGAGTGGGGTGGPDAAAGGAAGAGGGQGMAAPSGSLLERRQRQLDAFIQVLQARAK